MIDEAVVEFSAGSLMLLNGILAVVMFSIAIDLRPSDFRAFAKAPKPLVVGLLSQFLLLPFLTYLLVIVVQPQASVALGLILVAACPGGNISNFITYRAGGNAALSVSMTAFSTVGAILLTPANIAFWGSLYAPSAGLLRTTAIDPVSIAITVGLMLILPLVLGVTLNTRHPNLTARLRRPLQWISMVIFVGFVVLALAANWPTFVAFAGGIAGLVIAHNAIGLGGGYAFATLARLTPFNRRAVTIETGIQNSGLGLVLIFGFFGGLGGMAIVAAFWGIWHAISGLVLAWIMSRTEARR
ncbi:MULTISPECIES: bile acid:sodium symporter family protein [Roseobacteraceae]|jgi:BASS family bile acid:Na+ symporter|uniref:Pantothenates transporter PanS n=1 Tax=Pseudosulfitobacter pseudonitzschiae TaxID=1402135 RepID=A0A221JZQ1_9RHOB|nr:MULTISPECIES: bile acid:sodium symporter family protein [Roseobacteraceae]ASM72211.1 pantothenate precursors transporter PanS [Pseudosulfitobacter pseudonitzschiae]